MQLGVTANAQHHRVERRSILPIADVVKLQSLTRAALLTTIAGADKRGLSNGRFELTSHSPPAHRI